MSHIIDISQTIRPGIAVWPGDTEYRPFRVMQLDRGDSCNVGSITMSLHTGTHTDAPCHFLPDGASVAEIDLSRCIGPALVVDMTGVTVIDAEQIEKLGHERIERILIRTQSSDPDAFKTDFTYIAREGAEALIRLGIGLVGIDTPSVDRADSKTLDMHKILAAESIAILENLSLENVSPGRYELIALPLKLAGMDASPVRAILRPIENQA